ncbi:MAG: 1-acyl-sn-glycerol-3-phosphate acyltransferase [Bacteroidales bacterium]|nr:1-acyl-sn-glycerol-3-phosphate acyltransferase [Bacteroidales bacterium]
MNPFIWTYNHLSPRRWLALTLWLGALAVSLVLSSRIHLKEDIGDFLSTDSTSTRYMSVFQQIGGQNRIVVVASSDESDAEARADTIKAALADFTMFLSDADTAQVIKDVSIQTDEEAFAEMLDFIVDNAPLLLTKADLQRADSLLSSPTYVHEALEQNRQMLQFPTGGFTELTVRKDPLHLFTPLLTRLQTLRGNNNYTLDEGYIFTPDHRAGIGFITSPFGASESGQNRALKELLEKTAATTASAHSSVHVSTIGAPLIAVTNADQIKTDGLIAGLLSILLIALILWYVFRRVSDIMWMVLSILTGYTIALGVMSLYHHELSVIVLGTGSVLIGIAANYPLHYLDHRRHEHDERKALSDMVPPLLTGNITTVSAFACLAWMDSEAMRDLGVLGALVLIGTILFVLTILPVLAAKHRHPSAPDTASSSETIPVNEKAATKEEVTTNENADETKDFTPYRPEAATSPVAAKRSLWSQRLLQISRSPWFFLLMVAITCVLGYFSLQTTFDTNLQHINYMTTEQREHLSLLNVGLETATGNEVLSVSEGMTAEEALMNAEKMNDSLTSTGLQVRSLSGLMPSQHLQQENIARWNEFVSRHRQTLTDQLLTEGHALGFSGHAFEPFLTLLDTSWEPQDADFFKPIEAVIGAPFILRGEDTAPLRVVSYIQSAEPMAEAEKQQWRERFAHLGFVFDNRDVQTSLSTTLSDDFNYIGFVCGFVVFFFLWLSMASLELSLMSFLPLAVGWVWILGIMQLLGIQFNIVNIILATFIFGQGDDYTIFITEGLVHEHTYGRPVLKSYKNSVALSALLMFIGIGSLIIARHPAMRSLGEVVIVGMATVVLMAFYLPPLIFRWITTENGKLREVPLTLERIAFTVFASVFYLIVASIYQIFAFLWSHIGRYTKARKLFFHRTLCRISRFCIEHVPGTTFSVRNPYGETLERPAIIVANHQSQLDLMAVLSISPKAVILTKEWVWKNPLYSLILRAAEFYPVSEGVDNIHYRVADLLRRGYSVITFPEGTRSKDCQIHRFHQGAFHMAKEHGVDILPIFLTGLGHVLPKDELAFRRGQMHMEIGKRMTPEEFEQTDTRTLTHQFHHLFIEKYAALRREHEKTLAVLPYVRYQYIYKEVGVKREALRRLKEIKAKAAEIDAWSEGCERTIEHCGQGELAFVFALVHPDVQVVATDPDPDKIAVAQNVNIHLKNLRFEVS